MGLLDGRVALITGGGRGQGRAHAVAMAAEGADIAVCDLDGQLDAIPYPMNSPQDLDDTVIAVEKQGRRCLARTADVRDATAVQAFVDDALAEYGHIDILVANAGAYAGAPIHELTTAAWSTVVDTNLTGVFNAIRAVAPTMIAQRSGRVIATASGMGRHGTHNMAGYTASKWGVIGLIKTAAKELGPHNITANAINPGMVDTDIVRNDHVRALYNPELDHPTDADVDHKVMTMGLHHMPTPRIPAEDIAAAAVFLASDAARYVSGGTLDVGAGYAANHT
jgi:SDR family mycofactocin-dependent oxidoreductase